MVAQHHPRPSRISKPVMNLLVLAQLPPPVHGQSLMVETLVRGLPAQGVRICHVNLSLSRDAADVGRWRLGKVFGTLRAAFQTLVARFRHGCDTLYYVPAPAKRGALYRDFAIMALCRPFFPRLVLHWHSTGLSGWLSQRATTVERLLARKCLGDADLSGIELLLENLQSTLESRLVGLLFVCLIVGHGCCGV